jgi:hypothetical protein
MEIGSSPDSDNTAMFVAPLFTPSKYLANLNYTLTGGNNKYLFSTIGLLLTSESNDQIVLQYSNIGFTQLSNSFK